MIRQILTNIEYHIYQNESSDESLFMKIWPLFHVINVCKKSKINMDVMTFWSQLSSCHPFYIGPICIRYHHSEFVVDEKVPNCYRNNP